MLLCVVGDQSSQGRVRCHPAGRCSWNVGHEDKAVDSVVLHGGVDKSCDGCTPYALYSFLIRHTRLQSPAVAVDNFSFPSLTEI